MRSKKVWGVIGALCLILSSLSSVSAQSQSIPNDATVLTANDIHLYKTLPGTLEDEKDKGAVQHKEAIELINTHLLENGVKIDVDFDNFEYQQYVLSLGTAFDIFSAEDMKKIVSFVKFIDLYENYAKNDQLNEYKFKLNQKSQISKEEIEEIRALLPVFATEPITLGSEAPIFETLIESAYDLSITAANGYDNIAARDYAYVWWDGRNPTYSTYYAQKAGCDVNNETCWTKWNDCANFVSQALRAGGMNFQHGIHYTSNESWHFGPLVPSHTWGGAHNFYLHWKGRAGVASSVSDLQTGDAVNADFTGDGDIDHTALITKNTGNYNNNKYLTQHTSDRKEETTLQNWYGSSYTVYGYEIDKADN